MATTVFLFLVLVFVFSFLFLLPFPILLPPTEPCVAWANLGLIV